MNTLQVLEFHVKFSFLGVSWLSSLLLSGFEEIGVLKSWCDTLWMCGRSCHQRQWSSRMNPRNRNFVTQLRCAHRCTFVECTVESDQISTDAALENQQHFQQLWAEAVVKDIHRFSRRPREKIADEVLSIHGLLHQFVRPVPSWIRAANAFEYRQNLIHLAEF